MFLRVVQEDDKEDRVGVALCSIHSAKGLEWDTVFAVQVNNRSLPCNYKAPSGLQPLGHAVDFEQLRFVNGIRDVLKRWAHADSRPDLRVSLFPPEMAKMVSF